MRELHTEIDIDAPAERVWSLLTDLPGFAAWNPFIPEAEGEVRVGARLRVYIAPPGGKAMTFTPTVTHVEPHRSFRWLGRLFIPGLFDGEHIYELFPRDGGVRFVQRERFTGILVSLIWKSMEDATRAGFVAMNEALKREAERLTP